MRVPLWGYVWLVKANLCERKVLGGSPWGIIAFPMKSCQCHWSRSNMRRWLFTKGLQTQEWTTFVQKCPHYSLIENCQFSMDYFSLPSKCTSILNKILKFWTMVCFACIYHNFLKLAILNVIPKSWSSWKQLSSRHNRNWALKSIRNHNMLQEVKGQRTSGWSR